MLADVLRCWCVVLLEGWIVGVLGAQVVKSNLDTGKIILVGTTNMLHFGQDLFLFHDYFQAILDLRFNNTDAF